MVERLPLDPDDGLEGEALGSLPADVVEQLGRHHPEIDCQVHALDAGRGERYPAGVAAILADTAESYAVTARRINESGPDVVWLQHEFGIFGGKDGALVCGLVDQIAAPLVITFHTVLGEPSANQRRIVEHLISRASRIMVMSRHGRDLLVEAYRAPADRVEVIPHGAPDRPFGRTAEFKRRLGLEDRNVLMTFGLLGPGKGIEHVIEALPAIVQRWLKGAPIAFWVLDLWPETLEAMLAARARASNIEVLRR